MFTKKSNGTPLAIILLIALSTLAFVVNHSVYHYLGNNYFPPQALFSFVTLSLLYSGFRLQLGIHATPTRMAWEALYFFFMMGLLALATNAAQYTPYLTIDGQILALEAACHIHMQEILAWTQAHSWLKPYLEFCYDALPYQMAYIPLLVILTGRFDLLKEYYFLLIVSAIMGFTFYYFFPTTAPASMLNSNYFTLSQNATHLKFSQIHHHQQPTTLNGGLIALPSFHVIWAWFCVYLIREWRIAVVILLPMNSVLAVSCVLLGWHYTFDLVGSGLVIIISHRLYHLQTKHSQRHNLSPTALSST